MFSLENSKSMTKLGKFLARKSVYKSDVAGKIRICRARISKLTLNDNTKLRTDELYLIALAIDVSPSQLLDFICKDLKRLII